MSILTSTTEGYDEVLSNSTDNDDLDIDYDLTNFLLILFPFYILAIFMNFLSIYTILLAKSYRQYLSNVLLAVICIGSLVNAHGQMFFILLRWTNNSASNQLCSSSFYLRDSGFILLHTHILLLVFERILSYLKKQPTYSNNSLFQKVHFLLISISLISIILSLTVPIYAYQNSSYSSFNGLCISLNPHSFKNYLNWIYYGFGHPLLWLSLIFLSIFYFQQKSNTYTSLIPMNRMISLITLFTCMNLLIQTILDDIIGIGHDRPLSIETRPSMKINYLMNLRDIISFLHKILIGLVFFLFRPEIRSWLYDSLRKCQTNKKEILPAQRLELENEFDDNYEQINDGKVSLRADT